MNDIHRAEREESRAALHSLTEWDWAASPHEYDGLGMTGDKEDARNE